MEFLGFMMVGGGFVFWCGLVAGNGNSGLVKRLASIRERSERAILGWEAAHGKKFGF
jgi:hypothetical protein